MADSSIDGFDYRQSFNDTIWPPNIGDNDARIPWWKKPKMVHTVMLVVVILLLGLLFVFINAKMDKQQQLVKEVMEEFIKGQEMEAIIFAAVSYHVKNILLGLVAVPLLIVILWALLGRKHRSKANELTISGVNEPLEEENEEENQMTEEEEGQVEVEEGEEEQKLEEEVEEGEEEQKLEEEHEVEEDEEERDEENDESEDLLLEESGEDELLEEYEQQQVEHAEELVVGTEENGKCSKTLRKPSELNKHLRTHTGERRFQCDHCHKRFSHSSHMETHLRIHSGEKPFKCDHCHKRFSHSSNMKAHMRRIHDKKTTNQ